MSRATCVVPDCGRPMHGRGYCPMHYQRWRATGDPLKLKIVPRGAGHTRKDKGYRIVNRIDHPMADRLGRAKEHRVVLYDAIGPGPHPCHWCDVLLDWAKIHVDHLNRNPTDNRAANLVPACTQCNSSRSLGVRALERMLAHERAMQEGIE